MFHHASTTLFTPRHAMKKCLQVVVGVGDPNPLVASAGIATLETAGIEVSIMDGPERDACYAINEEFMERMKAQALAS